MHVSSLLELSFKPQQYPVAITQYWQVVSSWVWVLDRYQWLVKSVSASIVRLSLPQIVPMYVAECAPPEVRGLLITMQQFAIETGIMLSFWIDYGTNFW